MLLEYQVLAAVVLDAMVGDPRWLPHPVRGIGRLAAWVEPRARRWIPRAELAGGAAWALVVGAAGLAAWGGWAVCARLHPWAGDIAGIWIIYTTLAARDLVNHSSDVHGALVAGNLPDARQKVARIVGRDTEGLGEADVTRATVETVAESTLDGVTAPLFFAFLCGPVGAMVYRAVNTLDSMWGHKDERYLRFGWTAARTDDVLNWIPARLTGAFMAAAAWCVGVSGKGAWRVMRRDARKHPSPNSGFPEAAMAGALGVCLGGPNTYDGVPEERARMGDPPGVLETRHIAEANRLMAMTVILFALAGFAARQWLTVIGGR